MEIETRKDLIKKFREQVAGGNHGSRVTLLAYAFLRDKDYVALEKVINEDHPSFGTGRNAFLWWLSRCVAEAISKMQFSGKGPYDYRKNGEEKKAKEIEEFNTVVRTEVHDWIHEKYKDEQKSKEAAA